MAAADAGAVLLALPLSIGAAAQLGGRAADRFGTRAPAAVGSTLILVGGVLLLPLSTEWANVDVVLRLAVMGLGSGLLAGPNQAAILAAAPAALLGTAGGLSGLARTLGFALGPALATALWSHGELTPAAMRPAFALLVVLPACVLAAVLATPTVTPTGAPFAQGGSGPCPPVVGHPCGRRPRPRGISTTAGMGLTGGEPGPPRGMRSWLVARLAAPRLRSRARRRTG
jgi:MFS transporter, DHA2 family, multidrug resistance protein